MRAENHFTKVPDNLTQNKHENNKKTPLTYL